MKVLVCGSRTWQSAWAVWTLLDGILEQHPGMVLVHGDCPTGADAVADEWGMVRLDAHQVHPHPADWETHGKAAGPIRNGEMLKREHPDLVLAFVDKELADSRGTSGRRNGAARTADEPAMTIPAAADNGDIRWYARSREGGRVERHGPRPATPTTQPAPTVTEHARSDSWQVDRRTRSKAAGGGMEPTVPVPMTQPAPTLTGKGSQWVLSRPATTIVSSFRPDIVAAPGYRVAGSRQDAEGSVSITVEEAAILQAFRPDYPWTGSRTSKFRQIGNSVPPPMAAVVVAALLGIQPDHR